MEKERVVQTLAVVNEKGGVGKTTTAVNVAAALADLGLRLLVVDLDPQAAASAWLGINDPGDQLAATLTDDAPLLEAIVAAPVEGVDVAPASRRLAAAEVHLAREPGGTGILRAALAHLPADRWDLAIIDCPPTLGQLSVSALTAAGHVLIPVEASVGAYRALPQILRTIEALRARVNPDLEITGIAVVRLEPTRHAREIVDLLQRKFGELLLAPPIRKTVRLQDAQLYGQPITAYDSRSGGAEDYRALAVAVMERLELSVLAGVR
jgi:chromosome partitioning protein